MGDISRERLGEISERLRIASSWVTGPRQVSLLALAIEIEAGVSEEEALNFANAELASQSTGTAPTDSSASDAGTSDPSSAPAATDTTATDTPAPAPAAAADATTAQATPPATQ